jgi:hypothetical protein
VCTGTLVNYEQTVGERVAKRVLTPSSSILLAYRANLYPLTWRVSFSSSLVDGEADARYYPSSSGFGQLIGGARVQGV